MVAPHAHVDLLDLPSRVVFLDVEIETHKRKNDGDWLRMFCRGLRRMRIDDMLKSERRIAVLNHVRVKRVVRVRHVEPRTKNRHHQPQTTNH